MASTPSNANTGSQQSTSISQGNQPGKQTRTPKSRTFRQKWRAVSLNNKMLVVFTGVIMAATLIYTLFAGWQLYEIHAGGKDTHALVEASKKQAEQTELVVDAIRREVTVMELSNAQAKNALDKTIAENKKSLAATLSQGQKALDESIAASRSDQRAYVTIGKPDGTIADIIWPKEPGANAGIMVYFQNNGRIPAKFNWGSQWGIMEMVPADPTVTEFNKWNGAWTELDATRPFQPMYRARDKKSKGVNWSGTIDIAGGSSYQGVLWELPKERMLQVTNNTDRMILPSGIFEYCDGFGKRVCKTFRLSYAREPYNRFFLAMEDECQAIEMQIRHPIPDFEYLPPCALERPELQFTIPTLPKP
jgi:hypothetical protein